MLFTKVSDRIDHPVGASWFALCRSFRMASFVSSRRRRSTVLGHKHTTNRSCLLTRGGKAKGTCIRCRQTFRTPQEVEPDPVPVDAVLPLGYILSRGSLITTKRNSSPIYSRQGLIVERRTGIEFRKAMLNTVFVRRMERRV
jgi:hypothetical protein